MTTGFQALYDRAVARGQAAVAAARIQPMTVQQRANPMDDSSAVVESWYVPDGVCGFAWVNIKPGTNPFCKWLKATGKARKDEYYGGVTVWVSDYGQSMQKKEAFARGFAAELREAGFDRAYADSRMD